MKKISIIALTFFAVNAFGQSPKINMQKNDSIKVVYTGSLGEPAYFINDKLVDQSVIKTLNSSLIDSMTVLKDNIKIDNVIYHGQIRIKPKNNYNPKIISLKNLEKNYTNLGNKSTIFMIDGNIINADYEKYVVDENNVLEMIVNDVENAKENIDVTVINILTKSDENIKRSKEIRIRGTEIAKSN